MSEHSRAGARCGKKRREREGEGEFQEVATVPKKRRNCVTSRLSVQPSDSSVRDHFACSGLQGYEPWFRPASHPPGRPPERGCGSLDAGTPRSKPVRCRRKERAAAAE